MTSSAASSDGRYTDGITARDQEVCDRRVVEICINGGYAVALVPLHRQFAAMNRKAAGTALVATRLEQSAAGGPAVRPGFRRFDLPYFSDRLDVPGAVSGYVFEYGASLACQQDVSSYTEARTYVTAWLSGSEDWYGDPPDIDRYRALAALTPTEGNRWFRHHYRQFFNCTLRLDDLP